MANKIVTMQNADKTDNLLPRTKIKALSDDSGNYLDSGLSAEDLNQLKDVDVSTMQFVVDSGVFKIKYTH